MEGIPSRFLPTHLVRVKRYLQISTNTTRRSNTLLSSNRTHYLVIHQTTIMTSIRHTRYLINSSTKTFAIGTSRTRPTGRIRQVKRRLTRTILSIRTILRRRSFNTQHDHFNSCQHRAKANTLHHRRRPITQQRIFDN